MRGWSCKKIEMNTQPDSKTRQWLILFGIGIFLLLIHFFWYLGVWPGPMGQDGYSLIANINEGTPKYTGKEPAWLIYALATYGVTQRVEALVIPSIFLHVLVFTRIIAWTFEQGHKKTALVSLIFIASAPHVLNYETSLYPDSLFSLAFIGVLFEIWLSLRNKKLNGISGSIIFILFPMAAFFKGNGILILLPILYLATRLKKNERWILIAMTVGWIFAVQLGGKANHLGRGHGALDPLILFETVNFMQSKPMNLWENQHMVTDRTKEIIYQYISQEDIDTLFDRDYWDTLWHQNLDRVKFRHMSKAEKKTLRKEFFRYNLWRNIPAFTSSRVNIFLASSFAQGGMVGPRDAQHGLETVKTKSKYNPFNLEHIPNYINKFFEESYGLRFLLWTPLIGVFLIVHGLITSIKQKQRDDTVITLTIFIQLAGIFIFSIAAEYRYLLIIFFSPLLILPLIFHQRNIKKRLPSGSI